MNKRLIATVVGCLLVQLCVGILYLWSVFSADVVAYFAWNTGAAGLVASVMLFGFVAGNLLGGYLQDKTNPRLVASIGVVMFGGGIIATSFLTPASVALIYLTYGVLAGLGCGFAYASVLSCLQKWFPQKRGFASGLSVSAFGLSAVVFSPVAQALIKAYDRDMGKVFLTLGLIFLVVGLLACIVIRLPAAAAAREKPLEGLTPLKALRLPAFWCIFFASFFINGTWNIVMPVIKTLGQERHLSDTLAVATVSIAGVFNCGGRLSMAAVSDKIGRERTIICLSVLTALGAAAMIWAGGFFYVVVIAVIAFAYGGPSATFPAMTTDLCGSRYSGTNYGFALLSLGFSGLAFNGLSTLLVGATGGYTASFVMAAAISLIPALLMLIMLRLKRRRQLV